MADAFEETDPVIQLILGLRQTPMDVQEYLQRLQALRGYGVGPPGLGPLAQNPSSFGPPRPDLWGAPSPPPLFNPQAVLDPSQVLWHTSPAWAPWNRVPPPMPNQRAYDSLGEDVGVGYPH